MELIYRLFKLNAKIRREFSKEIETMGLTFPKWSVLKAVKLNPMIKAVELKDVVDMDKATLSELLSRLVKEEMIDRHENPSDRRCYHLKLSSKAEKMCCTAYQIEQKFISRFNSGLTNEEFVTFTMLIDKINIGLGDENNGDI